MDSDITDRLVDFIKSTGITVTFETIVTETFLPGVTIKDGCLIVDKNKLSYPGDLLHEAGHIAVSPTEKRATLNDNVDMLVEDAGNEMAAIAWSYAACCYLGLDSRVVFHEFGYKGAGGSIADNFDKGLYMGVPLLQWYGMTYETPKASELQVGPYPKMVNWLSQH